MYALVGLEASVDENVPSPVNVCIELPPEDE